MAQYTVKDTETGKTVTFQWNGDSPPTEDDMQEVFDAAGGGVAAPKEEPPAYETTDTGGFIETAMHGDLPYDPRKSLKNLPGSAVDYGKDMVGLARNLRDVPDTLGRLAGGAFQRLTGDEDNADTRMVDALVQSVGDSYGSMDKAFKTMENDPVGALADISGAVMGGGGLARLAGKASRSARLAEAGKEIVDLGAGMEPLAAVTKGVGNSIGKMVPEKTLDGMYEKALKPSTTLDRKTRSKLVKLGRELDLAPTDLGVDKLESIIAGTDAKIAKVISDAGASGKKINPTILFKNFQETLNDAKFSGLPQTAKDSVWKVFDEQFDQHFSGGGRQYTPAEMQKIKKTIYKELRSQYANTNYDSFSTQAQKGVARAAKESLEGLLPGIKELNKTDGDYIELLEVLQRSANRIGNNYTVSLRGAAATGTGSAAGYALGGPAGAKVGTVLGLGMAVFDQPLVKAKLSRIVTKLKNKGVEIDPKWAAFRLGLVGTGRAVNNAEEWTHKSTTVDNIDDEKLQRILGGE